MRMRRKKHDGDLSQSLFCVMLSPPSPFLAALRLAPARRGRGVASAPVTAGAEHPSQQSLGRPAGGRPKQQALRVLRYPSGEERVIRCVLCLSPRRRRLSGTGAFVS
jgi:hypothetical protein